MLKGEQIRVAVDLARLNAAEEAYFLERLREAGAFTEEEIEALQIVVAFFRLQLFPERTEAIKKAMAEHFYQTFNAD